MNEENYTSLELSKKLAEAGCELGSELSWMFLEGEWNVYTGADRRFSGLTQKEWAKAVEDMLPAYDILNDLCVKYAKEVFSKEVAQYGVFDCVYCPLHALSLLLEGKKQEAEDYIWKHCVFNKSKS